MKPKNKFVDIEKVVKQKNPGLAKLMPRFILNYIKRIMHEDEINDSMTRIGHLRGLDFVEASLEELHTKVEVRGLENIPKKEGVIIASNHPLGGLDGIALMSAVSKVRTDIQFLVNDILLSIENLSPLFVPINKVGNNPREASRVIEATYKKDIAILIFPAGLVSRKLKEGIADLEWKKSFITRAKKNKKNIIPVHIDGRNSNFFYNLSRIRGKLGIKANLEMFYLADEMYKQRNKTITISFGKPVPYSNFDKSKTMIEWAEEMRQSVYKLAETN